MIRRNIHSRILWPAALSLLVISAFLGCTIKQQVQLEANASGTVSMQIRLEPVFVQYIEDLSALTGESTEGQIFNVEEIKKEFAEREDVNLLAISTPTPDTLNMKLQFTSIEEVFASEQELQQSGIIRFEKVSQGFSVRFHLDRKNFSAVMTFIPALQNPLFEGLGPQENDDTTEEEYYELMDLALGEGGADSVRNAYIETKVTVRGNLVSQSGGKITADGVIFTVPLIRVLLLDKPLDYSLVFK
ncbi:MAG: hypothetical protein JSV89_03305 [Spirochaetaceae bacterium]|nr:MAG: hypothetical protein JSV89_03305 [Spirochaetaceae bacterium]